jgi:hypothetical protein
MSVDTGSVALKRAVRAKAQKSGLDSRRGAPARTLYRHDNGANRRAEAGKTKQMGAITAMKVIAARAPIVVVEERQKTVTGEHRIGHVAAICLLSVVQSSVDQNPSRDTH